jgi:hypothetical protein
MHLPRRARRRRKARRSPRRRRKKPERLAAAVLIHQKTDSERKKGKGKTRFVEKENEKSEILS